MASCEVPAKDVDFGPLNFPKNVDVNDDLPSEETLAKIADYSLLDVNGKQVPFRSLYEGTNGEKKHKVLVIFVRHFYCGSCQDYLEYLCTGLPSPTELQALPEAVSVIIIGCGAPSLIPFYAEKTSCTFRIYSEPTRHLYSVLQMTKSMARSETLPKYIKNTSLFESFMRSARQAWARVTHGDALKGGPGDQVGGEFLFEDGKMTWCHRMRNTMDHSDLQKIREVLTLPIAETSEEILTGVNNT
ncbi:hypothetical protein L207DRAFT_642119 [Hyaloscypha variabilis F]|uniref:Thioredoxin-like protein AAED1 n=1 Tax=Hyaloscypha variabilis (strain UAMH 11265 / GT02V1 / F) TaxID=1149755 RepID=A0A2J6QU33_HYAVF|nr:hypothetical protein L207DRAFT_642119 [Hyaloscypha variabilis F]